MKTVALLGGSRFIGYHLLLTLIQKGHEVTLFNRGFSRPPAPFPNNIKIINGDRNRPKDMDRLFNHDFDVVFDLSGFNLDHLEPIINNYRSKIAHYIFCSSTAVYKNLLYPQLKEESPRTLIKNTYGGNKALAENLLIDRYEKTQWPVTILRPQFVFGPYDNNGSSTRQLRFIFHRMTHSTPIPVKSRNKVQLNLLYVDDLVNGFVRCMENSVSHGKIYNIVGDDLTSEQEIIELSGKVCKIKPNIHWVNNHVYDDIKLGGPWREYDWIMDNAKIKKELALEFTTLEIALRKTHTWFRNTPHYSKLTSIRGEQYLLENRTIPKIVRVYWKCSDGVLQFLIFLYQKMGGRKNKLLHLAIKNIRNFLRLK